MFDIHFDTDFPTQLEPAMRALMQRFAPFVEHSVDRWWVDLGDGNGEDARVNVLRRYRTANVTVTAPFLKLDDEMQAAVIAHELAHALTTPIRDLTYELASSYVNDESAWKFVEARIVEANELQTEDMGRAMLKLTEPRNE